MRRVTTLALVVALLLPAGVAAQDDPQVVCTRLTVPPEHALADSPALVGEPEDGECDMVVYLPQVLSTQSAFGNLMDPAVFDTTLGRLVEEAIAAASGTADDGQPAIDLVDTPDFMGMTLEEAESVASELELVLEPSTSVTEGSEAGTIVGQFPGDGVEIPVGSTVTVQVAAAAESE